MKQIQIALVAGALVVVASVTSACSPAETQLAKDQGKAIAASFAACVTEKGAAAAAAYTSTPTAASVASTAALVAAQCGAAQIPAAVKLAEDEIRLALAGGNATLTSSPTVTP